MKERGRPRNRNTKCPGHIDSSKLPKYCYWDDSGSGHWYTTFFEAGKQKRRRIAGSDANLSDLHKVMEQDGNANCLNWLANKFEKSPQFNKAGQSQQKNYKYGRGIVCSHPTLNPKMTLGQIPLKDWKPGLVQKLIDSVGEKRGPSAAKKVKEYLSRVFNWGMNREYCERNPVGKPEMPPERKLRRLPERELLSRLVAFAKDRGSQAKRKGTCAPYIWIALEIARKCRLRGIEVFTMTDAQLLDEGILCKRRKGSKDNITRYDPILQGAINAALIHRTAVAKMVQIRPENRFVLVGTSGQAIKQRTWQSAWKRFMVLAIDKGVIKREERFGLHDMKRRGATDTPGTKEEKMEATGHKSIAMLEVYDTSIPVVDAAPD